MTSLTGSVAMVVGCVYTSYSPVHQTHHPMYGILSYMAKKNKEDVLLLVCKLQPCLSHLGKGLLLERSKVHWGQGVTVT